MKRLFVSFAFIFVVAPSYAVSFQISDIRLDGLQRVSASPVFAVMPIQVGDTVDSQDMRDTMQAIFSTGFFNNVQIGRDGSILIVILQERPAIKSIKIEGNKAIKTEQLNEVMTDNGLAEGEIFQRHLLEGITRELERQYISQARYDASVEASVKELPNNMIEIDIQVDEGSGAKIRHMNFVGNHIYSDEQLLELFELRPAKWYLPFSGKSKYSKEKLTGDLERLESYYLDRGYLDYEVVSTQVSISPDKKTVFITINVNEGEIYRVKTVDVAGDPIIPENAVRRIIRLREGDVFSQILMTSTTEYISSLLGEVGYSNASVEGIPKKNQEEHTVDLTFFVDPGQRVYVRRISFKGNTKTSDDVLRREMRQLEGASSSNSRIEQSKVRLERLGHFKEVTVETKEVPGRTDMADVEFVVEEQPSGSISASVGYSGYSGTNFAFNIQQNNWFGSGKQVSLSLNKNRYQDHFGLNYTDPYFTPDGVSRGFGVYYKAQNLGSFANFTPYSSDTYGADVTFGYPMSEISRVNFGFGVSNQAITTGAITPQEIKHSPNIADGKSLTYITQEDYQNFIVPFNASAPREFELETRLITGDVLIQGEPGFIDLHGTNYNNLSFKLGWLRRTLNRGILATRGTSQSLSFNATVPGSDLQYFKIRYDGEAFVPLTRHLTLRFKTTLGFGDGYGDMKELPFFENFNAGGRGSVRGFEPYSLGPKDSGFSRYFDTFTGWRDLNRNGVVDPTEYLGIAGFNSQGRVNSTHVLCQDPTAEQFEGCEPGKLVAQYQDSRGRGGYYRSSGGNIIANFSTNLLLPIPFIEDSRSMQLMLFVDAGNVFSTSCRERQRNCSNLDVDRLTSSTGISFVWISGFGPMTFTYSKPIKKDPLDIREAFQFDLGTTF